MFMIVHICPDVEGQLWARRLPLAVGGIAVNSVDDLDVDDLGRNLRIWMNLVSWEAKQSPGSCPLPGHADLVYETSLEDDKYTFIEGAPRHVVTDVAGGYEWCFCCL